MAQRAGVGTTIGMSKIKARRLNELNLSCHPGLRIGHCVPFYFCSRSVMLFLIHRRNEEIAYKGGQEPIVHLEADLHAAVAWAQASNRRWAFTLSNAGAHYFEDRSDIAQLSDINWDAVQARQWSGNGISRIGQRRQASGIPDRGGVPLASDRPNWHLLASLYASRGQCHAGRRASAGDRDQTRLVLLREEGDDRIQDRRHPAGRRRGASSIR